MLTRQKLQQLRLGLGLGDDAITDVGPVEAGGEDPRLFQLEPRQDVAARRAVGSGGQRQPRHGRKTLVQHRELPIFRPEVVTPLRNAMRFVDGEERDAAAREEIEAARRHQPLQRDQRRDDDAEPGTDQRRDLIAQRLATAGRHQHQSVAAGDHMLDDALLQPAERVIAENRSQDLERAGGTGIGRLGPCRASCRFHWPYYPSPAAAAMVPVRGAPHHVPATFRRGLAAETRPSERRQQSFNQFR
jgi:hypothetical protein